MATPQELTEAKKGFVISPAGYGKTHLIAEAVASTPTQRHLVLTHTHAGVDALRRKFKGLCPSSAYHVETIAGFALRFASAYPKLAQIENQKPATNTDWNSIYEGFFKLLQNKHIKSVLTVSYDGLYVDEYQDCTESQHNLVVLLSSLIPCRILGDPLQGIFDFKENPIVSWPTHIESAFEALPRLAIPWRWRNGNEELGGWLVDVRAAIESGQPVNLTGLPPSVTWVRLSSDRSAQQGQQRNSCLSVLNRTGSIIAIHSGFESQSNAFLRQLGGKYRSIETIECSDLMGFAKSIYETTGKSRIVQVIEFSKKCFSGIASVAALKTMKDAYGVEKDCSPKSSPEQVQSLKEILVDDSMKVVLNALNSLSLLSNGTDRYELYDAMCKSLQAFEMESHPTLWDAAWAVRNRTRQTGRRLPRAALGRTLLVKGLEFDHAIILDAEALTAKHLYVAMTRGRSSLTVLSQSSTLQPKK